MKRLTSLITLILIALTSAMAQPIAVSQAAKSVFTLTTFKKDGSILASSHGAFISADGTAISPWKPFVGADHAVVIDNKGKRYDVSCIVGANELYDMAKFCVDGKTVGAAFAQKPATTTSQTWKVNYTVGKAAGKQMKIQKVETFMDKYPYYILSSQIEDTDLGCPLVDAAGNLLGLLQRSGDECHATAARFAADMQVSGLTATDPVLHQTSIRIALPDNEKDATVALMLAAQNDSARYMATINDFIKKFPLNPDGYITRAQVEQRYNHCAEAAKDMETAVDKSTNKDGAHFSYAKLIYNHELYKTSDKDYADWSLDKAIAETQNAYRINPQPLYKHLEAQIRYTKGEYKEACDMFLGLTSTALRNPELFYEAAQCKMQLKADDKEILQMLDSAVAICKTPASQGDAIYYIARATQLDKMGMYRKALQDYNKYDTLRLGRVNAQFFYTREQCAMKCRLYQQALDDINLALRLAPQEPLFYAEKANVQLRVAQYYEAIATATHCLSIDANNPDAYLILGLAQIQTGQKKEGKQSLEKAKELGNAQAQSFIDKFK